MADSDRADPAQTSQRRPGALSRAIRWLRPRIFVMRLLEPGEADALRDHVLDKARQLQRGSSESPTAALDDWVDHRFKGPLVESAEAGPDYSKAFTVLSVLTIAAGLASSVVANAGHPSEVTIGVLGLAVGAFTAVNQIWNPAQRSVARYQAAYALRREGWDFVYDRGRYSRLKADQRLGAFLDEVSRIHRGVESIDESVASSQGH